MLKIESGSSLKKDKSLLLYLLFLLLLVIVVLITFCILKELGILRFLPKRREWPIAENILTSPTSKQAIPSPSPTVIQLSEEDASFIYQLPLWVPDIEWQEPQSGMTVARDPVGKVPLGTWISGISRTGTGISSVNVVPPNIHQKIHEELIKQEWQDSYPADAPGYSSYTYIKIKQGKQRVIDFSYTTKSAVVSAPGEPIQFAECPCPYELTVFYSDLF